MADTGFFSPGGPRKYDGKAQHGFALHIPFFVLSGVIALTDVLAITALMVASDAIYASLFSRELLIGDATMIGALTGALFSGFVFLRNGYGPNGLINRKQQFILGVHAWFFAFFATGWIAFLTKTTASFSRLTVLLFFLSGMLVFLILRMGLVALVTREVTRSKISLRTVYILTNGPAANLRSVLADLRGVGVDVVNAALTDIVIRGKTTEPNFSVKVAACRQAFQQRKFDAVYLFMPWRDFAADPAFREALTILPVPVYLFADDEFRSIVDGRRLESGMLTGFEVQREPLSLPERLAKAAIDKSIAATVLLAISPLLLFTALAILLESGRPIIFRQRRKGFSGQPFVIWKFRTMTVCEDGDAITQAQKNDRRVTALGRFLRKTSIDELPQLFNVLRGDMSLVGPRPHALAHDVLYGAEIAEYAYRHHVKPGLTGWAQVNGFRGETRTLDQMEKRIEHDLWYINNWSLWLDFRIMLRTVVTLLSDKNAY